MVGMKQCQSVDNEGGGFSVEHLQHQQGFSGQTILSETFLEERWEAAAATSVMYLRAALHRPGSAAGLSFSRCPAVEAAARVARLDRDLACATRWYAQWDSAKTWSIE